MTAVAQFSAADRAQLQRRVLRVLTLGQIVGSAALGAAITVGAFVIQDMLGAETPWGGIASATVTVGTAVASQRLARVSRRRGRRPGLQLGYGLAALGGLLAAAGAETGLLPVFLVGLFVYGGGQASNLQARYAAMDLAEPEHRSRAMSSVVFASTFGAVIGPVLIGPAEQLGEAVGLDTYTGPWILGAVVFAIAFANISLQLRPDPLVVIGAITPDFTTKSPPIGDALRIVGASAGARVALLVMVASHATMVGVMTMTPVHMKLHGHEGASQFVISAHVAGMFACSPLVGRYCDRRGTRPAILVGGLLLVGATVAASLSSLGWELLFPALWLLGLGWNVGLIGGSTLLTESVDLEHRVMVQGSADLFMSLCGGIAGLASGFIRSGLGYHALTMLATGAAVAMVVPVLSSHRAERPAASVPT